MLLSSYAFFVFFACVVVVHFLVPQRFRWIVLLAASAYFYYSFAPKFLLVIGGVILLTYGGALLVERSHGGRRKLYFVSSVVLTCLILFAFKYLPFMNANLSHLARVLDLHYPTFVINIALPVGLSFYIFQSLSYLIEVYWGRQKAERHLGYYAVYIMFFLRLIAGPIERPGSFLPQLRARKDFDWERILGGLKLMLWGLFKKLVIADRLGAIVANVYGHPHSYTGLSLVLATVFFSIQIFCDFSGYSDIAIGGAQIMGYRLTTNFDRPYYSKSIAEFWRRWHISFSSWLRDYLYIPLGGNRVPKWRWAVNTMIVFLVCGFWHGAGWTFVIWGALQGILSDRWEGDQETESRSCEIRTAGQVAASVFAVGDSGHVCAGLVWVAFLHGRQHSDLKIHRQAPRERLALQCRVPELDAPLHGDSALRLVRHPDCDPVLGVCASFTPHGGGRAAAVRRAACRRALAQPLCADCHDNSAGRVCEEQLHLRSVLVECLRQ